MQEQIYTLIADFSVKGNLAYLSHQETLKMFQRAFIRASIPLVFSCGFNPHPQISVPLPRSVGTQSKKDRVCAMVQFSVPPRSEDLLSRIQQHLPKDSCVLEVRCDKGKCSFQPQGVDYRFSLSPTEDEESIRHFRECQRQVQENSCIEVQRYWAKKRRYKRFDISPYVEALNVMGNSIEVSCHVSLSGTVRVDEIMQWLKIAPEALSEPVTRTEIRWSQN